MFLKTLAYTSEKNTLVVLRLTPSSTTKINEISCLKKTNFDMKLIDPAHTNLWIIPAGHFVFADYTVYI